MTPQKKWRYVLGAIAIIISCMSFYSQNMSGAWDTKREVSAQGVIENRFDTPYSCGHKGNDTCYSRFFTINGVDHKVNFETYEKFSIGQSVVLESEKYKNSPPAFVWFLALWYWLVIVLGIAAFIMFGLIFLFWAIFRSDDYTFKRYLRVVF